MKTKNKIIASFLVLLFVLSSCGGSTKNNENTENEVTQSTSSEDMFTAPEREVPDLTSINSELGEE